MSKKTKIVIISNIIFYFLVFFHRIVVKIYGDDYILQALFYIALSFSTLVIEESFRKGISKLKHVSVVDFILRVLVLIVHFMHLCLNLNIAIVNISISIMFILNILIEIFIFKVSKDFNEDKKEVIKDEELKEFINRFYSSELNTFKIGIKLNNELKDIISAIEVSGKGNLITIILFIAIFISDFVYRNFNKFIFLMIIAVVILLYVFVKLNSKLIRMSLKEEKNKREKNIFENISFIIGYIILFVCEVMLQGKLEYMRVSIWVVAIVAFIPVFNRKYKVKENLKTVYKQYNTILD